MPFFEPTLIRMRQVTGSPTMIHVMHIPGHDLKQVNCVLSQYSQHQNQPLSPNPIRKECEHQVPNKVTRLQEHM